MGTSSWSSRAGSRTHLSRHPFRDSVGPDLRYQQDPFPSSAWWATEHGRQGSPVVKRRWPMRPLEHQDSIPSFCSAVCRISRYLMFGPVRRARGPMFSPQALSNCPGELPPGLQCRKMRQRGEAKEGEQKLQFHHLKAPRSVLRAPVQVLCQLPLLFPGACISSFPSVITISGGFDKITRISGIVSPFAISIHLGLSPPTPVTLE